MEKEKNDDIEIEWVRGKFYNGVGKTHFNRVLKIDVPVPHVHNVDTPGGTRAALPEEIPKKANQSE